MADAITFDITGHLDTFNKLADDMPFIISKSMNDVAFKDARPDLSKDMQTSLIIRSKGITRNTMFQVVKSNKKNLEVEMFHRVPGIGLQQSGGTETPKGKKLAIPNRKNLSKFMGVSEKKIIPKRLKIETIMKKAPSSRNEATYTTSGKKVFILPSGVYIRMGNDIKAIYHFVDKATHSNKTFDFQGVMEKSFNRRFTKRFNVNYLKILKG